MSPKGSSTEPRANVTERDWIEAAKQTLIGEGIGAVKVERLAKKLGVTRGGFYWRFRSRSQLLDALLDDWRETNTKPLLRTLEGPGSPQVRFRRLMRLWIEEREYSPDYDTAVRSWSQISPKAARVVHEVDDERIAAFAKLFEEAAYAKDEAFIRARITYFHQVGYYAMGLKESARRRQSLSELYYRALTGFDDPT